MKFESEPTPLATKWFGGFYNGSNANVGYYKMTLRNHFVVKTGCNKNNNSLLNILGEILWGSKNDLYAQFQFQLIGFETKSVPFFLFKISI